MRWGGGEDPGGFQGGETLIRIYCIKEFYSIEKEFQKIKANFKMAIISLMPYISVPAARHRARRE